MAIHKGRYRSPVSLTGCSSVCVRPQVLIFFTWTVRGIAEAVSMWDTVERVASFCTQLPMEAGKASNLDQVCGAEAFEAQLL